MNDQLQGLLIPLKEAEPNMMLWIALLILLFLLGVLFWRWNNHRRLPSIIAQKRLKKLMGSSSNTVDKSQVSALEIANILCQGLGVRRLDQFQASDKPKWMKFHNRLNDACYSRKKKNDIDIRSLINEAHKWLAQG